ncbi:hypothetical protein TARUN_2855 [Trichoderma arundinaceum]|uniref:F-box domain-containing protein n=1 Tax=Trichoderma arundinaceum TaxID=490622 RepID=A0A395NTI9_TRIAR|nr:hypothetical protein TARUN_2855 [Trichoderma arundinaceum]
MSTRDKEAGLGPPHPLKSHGSSPNLISSPLLALPSEIIREIVDLLADDNATLSALALVNSDCRHLARSRQFADIRIDYGRRSPQLLNHLSSEVKTRANITSVITCPPFIGPYIRRITVNPKLNSLEDACQDLLESTRGHMTILTQAQRAEKRQKAKDRYLTIYRNPLLIALTRAMPNLEALSWFDMACLDENFFRTVASLPIQHLKLEARIVAPYRLEPPLVPPAIPLRSLDLDIAICRDRCHEGGIADYPGVRTKISLSPFITTFLQICSGTLESLTLKHRQRGQSSFSLENVTFDRLQYLSMRDTLTYPDPEAWSHLLTPRLKHLELPLRGLDNFEQFISTCQRLPNLETLVVPDLYSVDTETAGPIINFISLHHRIRKLSINYGRPQVMNNQLLPLLSNGEWSYLTSLSLSWRGPEMEEETSLRIAYVTPESLDAINSISSLEQLCLGAGEFAGWRHQWLIDHNEIRSRLRGLEKLKRLAFSRDTYNNLDNLDEESSRHVERYYKDRMVTPAVRHDAFMMPHLDNVEGNHDDAESIEGDDGNIIPNSIIWERAHRNRMLWEAERYAAVFPRLHWIYCGQLPISIRTKQESKGTVYVATPLGKARDPSWLDLARTFEMEKDDWSKPFT